MDKKIRYEIRLSNSGEVLHRLRSLEVANILMLQYNPSEVQLFKLGIPDKLLM